MELPGGLEQWARPGAGKLETRAQAGWIQQMRDEGLLGNSRLVRAEGDVFGLFWIFCGHHGHASRHGLAIVYLECVSFPGRHRPDARTHHPTAGHRGERHMWQMADPRLFMPGSRKDRRALRRSHGY